MSMHIKLIVISLFLLQIECAGLVPGISRFKPTVNNQANSINNFKICGKKPTIVHYIHGGRSSMIEQWPWQIHLKIADSHAFDVSNYDYSNCGASLLNDYWIVTAAHCLSERQFPKIFMLLGHNSTKKVNYREIKYEKIILHPSYKEFTTAQEYSTNDIALIKLRNKIKGRIVPLCLPEQGAILPSKSLCYITGFGATSKDDNEQVKGLREGRVTIKHNNICKKSLSLDYFDNKSMICAGKSKGKVRDPGANSCQGDSGGPLVCEGSFGNDNSTSWYLFGITSFGALDCDAYSNSVYTRVSNYVNWIRQTISAYN